MAKFKVAVDHSLQREAAVTRLQGFSEKVRENAPVEVTDLKEDWDENGNLEFAFKAMGFAITGFVETSDIDVKVTGDLPFAALPFRGMIEKEVENQIREAMA